MPWTCISQVLVYPLKVRRAWQLSPHLRRMLKGLQQSRANRVLRLLHHMSVPAVAAPVSVLIVVFCGTVVTPTVLQLSKVIPFSCLPLTRSCTRLQRHLSKCPLSSAAPGRPEETKPKAKDTHVHHFICRGELRRRWIRNHASNTALHCGQRVGLASLPF